MVDLCHLSPPWRWDALRHQMGKFRRAFPHPEKAGNHADDYCFFFHDFGDARPHLFIAENPL